MYNSEWVAWTVRACRRIRFGLDRRAAERELMAHLEDKARTLMEESGLTERQAQEKALAAMGDADEVGRLLAAVQRPWLGRLWECSRWLLALCVIGTALLAFAFLRQMDTASSLSGNGPRYWQGESWYADPPSETHWTELSPHCRDGSDGYTFTVPAAARVHAAAYTEESPDGSSYEVAEGVSLYLTVRATSWLPGAEGFGAFGDFYAVDDLGNRYWSANDPNSFHWWPYNPVLWGNSDTTSPWTSVYEASIHDIHPEAEWIELRYDREGRDVRLRIDLTGGEGT